MASVHRTMVLALVALCTSGIPTADGVAILSSDGAAVLSSDGAAVLSSDGAAVLSSDGAVFPPLGSVAEAPGVALPTSEASKNTQGIKKPPVNLVKWNAARPAREASLSAKAPPLNRVTRVPSIGSIPLRGEGEVLPLFPPLGTPPPALEEGALGTLLVGAGDSLDVGEGGQVAGSSRALHRNNSMASPSPPLTPPPSLQLPLQPSPPQWHHQGRRQEDSRETLDKSAWSEEISGDIGGDHWRILQLTPRPLSSQATFPSSFENEISSSDEVVGRDYIQSASPSIIYLPPSTSRQSPNSPGSSPTNLQVKKPFRPSIRYDGSAVNTGAGVTILSASVDSSSPRGRTYADLSESRRKQVRLVSERRSAQGREPQLVSERRSAQGREPQLVSERRGSQGGGFRPSPRVEDSVFRPMHAFVAARISRRVWKWE